MRKAELSLCAGLVLANPVDANSIGAEHDAPYEICALCHSLDGVSRMAKFPKLAGQPVPYIEKQLHDFLEGKRTNDGGQMSVIVTEITPDDFPVVAAWFSAQSAPLAEDLGDVTDGMTAYQVLGCGSCHDDANATEVTPHLTAQHAGYLEKQMYDFRDGDRTNNAAMQAAMVNVTDTEIAALAAFLAASERQP